MKIGILTVPFNNNYGGFLQAFALKTTLEKMGHNVIFINRRRNKPIRPLWEKILAYPLIKLREIQFFFIDRRLSKHTNSFKKKYLAPITAAFYTHNSLKKCMLLNIDAFIVGSDQVWRFRYAKESVDDFFFSFLHENKTPRFSYAASFGTDENEFPPYYVDLCKKLLNQFVSISVRENSGKDLLIKNFQLQPKNVKVVLDPTLLLNSEEYKKLFVHYPHHNDLYLCTYILDDSIEIRNLISIVAEKMGNKITALKAQTGNIKKMTTIEPVERWLHEIAEASFVITDSFHGTVFSIIFNKPFLVIGNETRGRARFQSLLALFGLESRYIDNVLEFDESLLYDSIDWNVINSKINLYKRKSLSFLVDSLTLCEKSILCQ